MNKESTSKTLDNLKWLLALAVFAFAVVGNSYFIEIPFLYRVIGVLVLFIIGLGIIAVTNFGSNAIKLMKESRTEIRKVVWPTRMETTQTFMVVFASIVVLCLFFIVVLCFWLLPRIIRSLNLSKLSKIYFSSIGDAEVVYV